MTKKLSPRAKFIKEVDLKKLAGYAWDAMQLANTHDPDQQKELKELRKRIDALETHATSTTYLTRDLIRY